MIKWEISAVVQTGRVWPCLDPVPASPLTPNWRHLHPLTAAPHFSMKLNKMPHTASWFLIEWQHNLSWTSSLFAVHYRWCERSVFLGHGGDAVVMATHLLQDGGELVEVSVREVLSFPEIQNHSGWTRLSRKVVEIPEKHEYRKHDIAPYSYLCWKFNMFYAILMWQCLFFLHNLLWLFSLFIWNFGTNQQIRLFLNINVNLMHYICEIISLIIMQ